MKKLILPFLLFFFAKSFAQTTPLSFTELTSIFQAPNKGAQHWGTSDWDDVNQPKMPAGNAIPMNYYTRFNWRDIESSTSKGTYDWTVFDNFVKAAIDNNAMYSFGIMAFCNGCGTFGQIPAYVITDMSTEGKASWSDGGFAMPNYQSTSWKNDYCGLLRAVADHINTTSYSGHTFASAFLGYDFRHYGNFGEGNGIATSAGCPSGAQVTDTYMMAMIDSTIAIFPSRQLTFPTSYASPYGNDYGNSDGMVDTHAAWYMLTKFNSYGYFGWRRDNLGDDGYNSIITGCTGSYNPGTGLIQLKPLLVDRWKLAPLGGEPAIDYCGTSRCGSIYCDLHNEDTLHHLSYFGNGNYPILVTANGTVNCSSNTPQNTTHGGDSLIAHTRAASAEQGYRLLCTGGSTTTSPTAGGSFNISIDWKNTGLAPVYEAWDVTYELRSGSTVVWTHTSGFSPRLFLPSTSSTTQTDNLTLTGVSSGTYDLYLIVKDPGSYKKPLPLAITGRNADGSYTLRTGIVVSAGGSVTADAGTDQSITLPTSSVTLDGTGSTGTITDYLWTKISGPNTPTIVSSTSSTTSVTGLIAGTYVFQLSLNSGTSTDQVSIVVNPIRTSIILVKPGTKIHWQ